MSTPDDASGSETTGRDRHTGDRADTTQWLAESALRVGLALIGVVLLVYALGRAVGVDLLAIVVDAALSPLGRWLLVACFALVLIAVAQRGFGSRT